MPTRRRRQPDAWPGRRAIAIAVGALVVATVVWWNTGRDPLPAASARVAPEVARPAPVATSPRVVELPAPPVTPYPVRSAGGLTADDPLTAYKKANVYPPTSRPLTRDNVELLHPGDREELVRPTDKGLGLSFLFTADRYFVIGDQPLTAWLEVRNKDQLIPVTIKQAYAVVLTPPGHDDKQIPLTFAAHGGRMTTTFEPATLPLRRQAAIGMYIEFDHGSGVQRAHFDFLYTPAVGIPARFTGKFGEEVANGSLVIHAGVEVHSAGLYVIDCNLFDAADQPVAWTRFKGELAEGTQDAALMFFGKVIRDGEARGPFHIGQLRGARYAPGEDPDLEQMAMFAGSYATRAYGPEAFSDAEYDSADKQRMIELLSTDHGHRGGAGHPGSGSGE